MHVVYTLRSVNNPNMVVGVFRVRQDALNWLFITADKEQWFYKLSEKECGYDGSGVWAVQDPSQTTLWFIVEDMFSRPVAQRTSDGRWVR